ncbi:hypothetical protein [Streptacidiphilus carbonis]|jgi:capsular polysaccharide biosynthesis protein|uniref:hypothetical protein n=1 Tax=Streptacidiphilus carbonis TaxID=105422 RepID=UPI0007C80D2C|nr:hypothetical protein [Streptacidiphilus carbonis]
MDLAEIARVVRRRWYVMLPGLLVTVVMVAGLLFAVPTKYQSSSTVMLLNSEKATAPAPYDGNPFLSTQTSITGTVDILARSLMDDNSLAVLKSKGLTGTVVAKIADNAQAPLMDLTVTGTDKAAVLASEQILSAYAKQRLEDLQAERNIAPAAMITMIAIVPPTQPVAQTKSKIEYAVILALLGIALSLVLVFWTEARNRRPAGPGADGADGLAGVGEADGNGEGDGSGEDGEAALAGGGGGREEGRAVTGPQPRAGAQAPRPGVQAGKESRAAGGPRTAAESRAAAEPRSAAGARAEAGARAASESDGESLENPTVQLSVLSMDETRAPWRR